jgi:hypothetical protein
MTFPSPFPYKFSLLFLLACFFTALSPSSSFADENEPIAYIGHGGVFDHKGNQIVPTADFVAKAQAWYQVKLLSNLNAEKKAEFATFEKQLNTAFKAKGQAHLVVQHRLLDWLIANSDQLKIDQRTVGKLNALKYELRWVLPQSPEREKLQNRQEFKLDPEIENTLKQSAFAPGGGGLHVLTATTNSGQSYVNECNTDGVPIPPTIGVLDPLGLAGWKSQGFIPQSTQFIVGTPAEVRTYHSTAPEGLCIALPRYSDATLATVSLDGVICLGKISSKVCFWDNQMMGAQFSFASGTQIPIGAPNTGIDPSGRYQAGGFELNGGSGGVCTDCHAGENPYIIHPNADLGGGNLMGQLNQPPQNLPTFGINRYDPLVAAAWPQNALSHSPTLVPTACKGCHQQGIAGRFPHLSSELPGYCGTILAQALTKTMPPPAPGSQVGTPEVVAFQNWCGSPASAGPSDRGDPHLTTANGTNYDFQSAGEFIALRNSDSHFELQTRQTPISTVTTPVANAYTGLATCVSLNTAAAARLGRHRVSYEPGPRGFVNAEQLQLRIDGALFDLPGGGINLGGGNSIARATSGGGLDLNSEDGTRVLITPNFWAQQGVWYLDVEALNTPAREGTMGPIPTDNWLPLAPDGSSFGPEPAALADRFALLNSKFADAWRVTNKTSLFDYAPGTSTNDFTDRNWPPPLGQACNVPHTTHRPPQGMRPELARRFCRVIKDKTAFGECVFDLTETGNVGFVKSYLRTLKLREHPNPPACDCDEDRRR